MPDEEKGLWDRFTEVVAWVWCWFVTFAVPIFVLLLVSYAIYKFSVAVFVFLTTVVFVAAPTGPLDVLFTFLSIIIIIILYYLLYLIVIELWEWAQRWIEKRILKCR